MVTSSWKENAGIPHPKRSQLFRCSFLDGFFGKGKPNGNCCTSMTSRTPGLPLCEWLANGIQATPSQANKPNLDCKYPTNIEIDHLQKSLRIFFDFWIGYINIYISKYLRSKYLGNLIFLYHQQVPEKWGPHLGSKDASVNFGVLG